MSRSSVIPLKNEQKEQYKDEMKKLQDTVNEKYDEYDPDAINVYDNDDIEDPFTDVDKPETDEEDGGPTGNTGKNDTVEGPSLFENVEIYLPHRDRNEIAKVIGWKRNADGILSDEHTAIPYWTHKFSQYNFQTEIKKI